MRRRRNPRDTYPWGDMDASLPWRSHGKGGEQRILVYLFLIYGAAFLILTLGHYLNGKIF